MTTTSPLRSTSTACRIPSFTSRWKSGPANGWSKSSTRASRWLSIRAAGLSGRFSTRAEHMPSNHRFVLELDADWLLEQAQAVGPHTTALSNRFACNPGLSPNKPTVPAWVCSAWRANIPTHSWKQPVCGCKQLILLSYRDLKSELEALVHPSDNRIVHPAVHENIRGETYYH